MKLNDIYNIWVEDKTHFVKKSTMSAYLLLYRNHIGKYFGELESISEDVVQQFVFNKLDEGLSKKTIGDMLILLKMLCKFGSKKCGYTYEQWEIRWPTNCDKTTKSKILSPHEHKALMADIKNNFTFRKLGILLALQGGFRIGELCAMTWEDIDMDEKVIHVRKTIQRIYNIGDVKGKTELIIDEPKTKNSKRDVPMARDTYNILKPIVKIMNPDYYILTNEPKPTEPRTYRNYYQSYIQKQGIEGVKFHGLRHSFATRCIENKADVKTVSQILGHSNISTTMNLYVHPTQEQKKSTIDYVMKKLGC